MRIAMTAFRRSQKPARKIANPLFSFAQTMDSPLSVKDEEEQL
jgi:hypothetical protein